MALNDDTDSFEKDEGKMKRVFVSGHLDLTREEFERHYVPALTRALYGGVSKWIVGDACGADAMAQQWFAETNAIRADYDFPPIPVVIYHMFEKPRFSVTGFETVGGFSNDEERDSAMTAASDVDVAWVRPGKENSGTAKNLARRMGS